ncbi:hypothetical protein [Dictyobacter aurantiacus]|uniref:Uncharacterized protein n=1 Tax=Dictyobacter aurantiacus TaxID=1936993 RepID=A0A401ZH09_9CHLR|nr:hypothetical protein [Dictyobacter aurantiacus]GCE06132.1 hypothetical protein KDAU_34610 [Dictyobacter aurantiacus]
MGLLNKMNPFKGRQPGAPGVFNPVITPVPDPNASPQQQSTNQSQSNGPPDPDTGPLAGNANGSAAPGAASDMLNLVNYTPEQLVSHVDQRVSRIQFGWSFSTKLMEGYSEIWAWMGPIVLVIGTIGEVFLVLWLRQKVQEIIAGVSIVAVALVLEGTFLAVSYKAATIRNRAERRTNGPNELDKRKLKRQFYFWCALAIGVCATQVIFVAAQTRDDGIGLYGVWIFAILRAVFTLVADGYTAFAHEEKPTTADQALEEEEQRTKASDLLLAQKTKEVDTINAGILRVREASVEAKIKDDKMQTRLTTERMQNQALIDALRTQQETANMTIQMLTNLNRAIMDPTMPADQRQIAINTMIALGNGYSKVVPSTTSITVQEEEED